MVPKGRLIGELSLDVLFVSRNDLLEIYQTNDPYR